MRNKKAQVEFYNIQKMDFWKEYSRLLMEERKRASTHCEKDSEVREWQGFIRAIDNVIKLPDRVLEGKKKIEDTP